MKPQCGSVQQSLSDYIDHVLSARQSESVASHLRMCSICQQEFESLRRTTGLLNYYVEPGAPDGYHERFWRELQCKIEQENSGSTWSSASGLCRAVFLSGQYFFNGLCYLFETLVSVRRLVSNTRKRPGPLSLMIFGLLVFGVFVTTQLMHLFEQREWAQVDQLQNPLRAFPVQLVKTPGNRELVARRDRVLVLPQVLYHEVRQSSRKVNCQLDTAELPGQGWGSHSGSSFAENREMLRELRGERDVFRDLLAFAQLSVPGLALATHDFSGPVGINSPFPDKFEREGPQLNAFVGVLKNVAVRDLSLAEVYDSVKL